MNIDIIGNTYNWGWSNGESLGKSNLPHFSPPPTNEKIKHSRVPGQYDAFGSKEFLQTSSDESSSATADSDSSDSNKKFHLSKPSNIVITEDDSLDTSGSKFDKMNEILLDKFSLKIIIVVKNLNVSVTNT